jgi:hypothetical protein
MPTLEVTVMTPAEHKDAVYQSCKDNHIWVNAFDCIRPTDEFAAKVGHMILGKLNGRHYTIPTNGLEPEEGQNDPKMREALEFFASKPMLYLSINKS